jgi:hypothetical protein
VGLCPVDGGRRVGLNQRLTFDVLTTWGTACREYNARSGSHECLAAYAMSRCRSLSPMARRPDALFAMNIASLIFLPDLRFLALTSFQSLNRPSLSSGSSSPISLLKQSFSVSRPRLRPPGNIHRSSRRRLSNNTHPRLLQRVSMTLPLRFRTASMPNRQRKFYFHPVHIERQRLVQRTCRKRSVKSISSFWRSAGHFRYSPIN